MLFNGALSVINVLLNTHDYNGVLMGTRYPFDERFEYVRTETVVDMSELRFKNVRKVSTGEELQFDTWLREKIGNDKYCYVCLAEGPARFMLQIKTLPDDIAVQSIQTDAHINFVTHKEICLLDI